MTDFDPYAEIKRLKNKKAMKLRIIVDLPNNDDLCPGVEVERVLAAITEQIRAAAYPPDLIAGLLKYDGGRILRMGERVGVWSVE